MRPLSSQAIAAIALLLISACGGGGGGSVPTTDTAMPPAVENPPPPPQAEQEPTEPDDMPEPEPDPPVVPPAPSGVEVSAGIGIAIVSWDSPFRHYDEHGVTHIYRSTSNNFYTATHIGTSDGFLYTDENLQHRTTYYYWVVWESEDGLRGPVSSSVHDTTALNPGDIPDVQLPPEDDEEEPEPEADSGPLSGPATLSSVGSTRTAGTASYTEVNVGGRFPGTFAGTRPIHSFDNWGLWAKVGDATLFRADIRPGSFGIGYTRHIEGTQTGSRPISGSAVWKGSVYAYDAHPNTYGTPVKGTARLQVNFKTTTVDVDFTGFNGGHPNLSWSGVSISNNGRFYRSSGAHNEMFGAFYGAEHQGVAGKFTHGRLDGVFGATR